MPQSLPPDLLTLSPDAHSALSDACDWLTDYLNTGPRPIREILRDARPLGITVGTLRRAKRILAIRSLKPSNDVGWQWSFRPQSHNQHAQLQGAHK